MGLFGNWGFRKEHYCPKCFGNKGSFFGLDFFCDNCKWKGKESDLLSKSQAINLRRKLIIKDIKNKINVKRRCCINSNKPICLVLYR